MVYIVISKYIIVKIVPHMGTIVMTCEVIISYSAIHITKGREYGEMYKGKRGNGISYYTLEAAVAHKSKTSPFPFIIGHECNVPYRDKDGKECVRTREYYAFDSIDTFLEERYLYQHSHEMVVNRGTLPQAGRIVFDFDVEEKYYETFLLLGRRNVISPQKDSTGTNSGFVSPNFELDVERVIKTTLKRYYTDVDINRISFIWLGCKNEKKFSRHLILVGSLMKDEWDLQLQTFYSLFRYEAYISGLFNYIINLETKLFDGQIARKNGSVRLCGAKKMKPGANPFVTMIRLNDTGKILMPDVMGLTIDRNGLAQKGNNGNINVVSSFYDTTVQVLNREKIKVEQSIPMTKLALGVVFSLKESLLEDAGEDASQVDNKKKELLKYIPQLRRALEDMDKENEEYTQATDEHMDYIDQLGGCYEYYKTDRDRILLNRISSGPCPVSGYTHDSAGGFIKLYNNGGIRFYCFRGCNNGGKKGILLKKGEEKEMTVEEAEEHLLNLERDRKELEEEEERDEEDRRMKEQMKKALVDFEAEKKKHKKRGTVKRIEKREARLESHEQLTQGITFKKEAGDVLMNWMKSHKT